MMIEIAEKFAANKIPECELNQFKDRMLEEKGFVIPRKVKVRSAAAKRPAAASIAVKAAKAVDKSTKGVVKAKGVLKKPAAVKSEDMASIDGSDVEEEEEEEEE